MNKNIKKYLDDLGYNGINYSYYELIKKWEDIWKGKTDFHRYFDESGAERYLYSLGMAKKICEDWASILWNEKSEITVSKKKDNKYLNELLKNINFYGRFPNIIEKSFASGTCGIVARIKNAKIINEKITKGEDTKVDFISVTADKIVPLTTIDGVIKEVAFISQIIKKGKTYDYIETHTLTGIGEQEHYVINNVYLDDKGREVLFEDTIPKFETTNNTPLFSILSPNILNPYENSNGLGFSIFALAEDQLQHIDISYNNYVKDFYLGGKKVFYNKNLVKTKTKTRKKPNGDVETYEAPVYPDNVLKQQFMILGDPNLNINDNPVIHEYNPDLRVNDNSKGLQDALDYCSFKCGMGTKYYRFDISNGITATQYMGERQDLICNANKHLKNVNKCIIEIIQALIYLSKIVLEIPLDNNIQIEVVNDDSFAMTTEEQKAEFRNDIAIGVRSKYEYRMKFLGESEDEAKESIAYISSEDMAQPQEIDLA